MFTLSEANTYLNKCFVKNRHNLLAHLSCKNYASFIQHERELHLPSW